MWWCDKERAREREFRKGLFRWFGCYGKWNWIFNHSWIQGHGFEYLFWCCTNTYMKSKKTCSAFSRCAQDMIGHFDFVCHVKNHGVIVAYIFALSVVGTLSQGHEKKHLSVICSSFDSRTEDRQDWNQYDSIIFNHMYCCCNLLTSFAYSTSESGWPNELVASAVEKSVLLRKFSIDSSASSLIDAPVTQSKALNTQSI